MFIFTKMNAKDITTFEDILATLEQKLAVTSEVLELQDGDNAQTKAVLNSAVVELGQVRWKVAEIKEKTANWNMQIRQVY